MVQVSVVHPNEVEWSLHGNGKWCEYLLLVLSGLKKTTFTGSDRAGEQYWHDTISADSRTVISLQVSSFGLEMYRGICVGVVEHYTYTLATSLRSLQA